MRCDDDKLMRYRTCSSDDGNGRSKAEMDGVMRESDEHESG